MNIDEETNKDVIKPLRNPKLKYTRKATIDLTQISVLFVTKICYFS